MKHRTLSILLSALLSAVMSFSISAPAFAADVTEVIYADELDDFTDKLMAAEKKYNTDGDISAFSEDDGTDDTGGANRLIVKSAGTLDYYGADFAVYGYDGLHIIQYDSRDKMQAALNLYTEDDEIEYAEEDFTITLDEPDIDSDDESELDADDTLFAASDSDYKSWGYGSDYIGVDDYKEKYLSNTSSLPEIIAAVIDTGIYADHEMFEDRILSSGYDYVKGDSNPDDDNGHGTHVSGIICDGTEDNVKLLPLKILNASGSGSSSNACLAIRRAADSGADVINVSLGAIMAYSQTLADAIDYAYDKGSAIFSAAGNFSINVENVQPASVPEMISVSNMTKTYQRSSTSCYGEDVDLAAPGVSISSAAITGTSSYTSRSGTSMASPHAAAAAADILSADDSLTPRDVELLMKYNSGKLIAAENYPFGAGMVKLSDFVFDGIVLGKTDIETVPGGVIQISAESLNNDTLTWVSSDNDVATVSKNGTVTAVSKGSAVITAANGNVEASCTVTVNSVGDWYDPEQSELYIGTAQELYELEETVNGCADSFEGKTIYLTSDINMSGISWRSIGVSDYDGDNVVPFSGTFDGNGHAITNLKISKTNGYMGLFGIVSESGTIKDLTVAATSAAGEKCLGIICGKNYGTIVGCSSSGSASVSGAYQLDFGGICGMNYGTILNCESTAALSASSAIYIYAGGICGTSSGSVENCLSAATVTVTNNSSTYSKNKNYVGGICGNNSGTIFNSVGNHTATLSVSGSSYSGGLCGTNSSSIKNSYWNETFTAAAAETEKGSSVKKCSAFSGTSLTKSVTADTYTGKDLLSALNYNVEYKNSSGVIYNYDFWSYDDSIYLEPTAYVSYDGEYADVKINSLTERTAYAVFYDDGGHLLHLASFDTGSKARIEYADATSVTVILWDSLDGMKPLMAAERTK